MDAVCGRCTAYLLRFDPFLIRPGVPGPSVDRDVRRGVAMLTLDPGEPVRVGAPAPRVRDAAFAQQFLAHLALPDGGTAVLTRGDREVLTALLRAWAREPPSGALEGTVLGLYSEAASLPGMPVEAADLFRSLSGEPTPTAVDIPGPAPGPIPLPEPEPVPEPEPGPEPEEEVEPVPEPEELPEPVPEPESIPEAEPEPEELPPPPPEPIPEEPPLPPPPAPEPSQEEWEALESLKVELAAKKEELARWLLDQRQEMARREGAVTNQIEGLRQREMAIAEKERTIAEEERRLGERSEEVRRKAEEAGGAMAKRSLFFLLFSMDGMSRHAAHALADAFLTQDRLREASLEEIGAIEGVLPEQAALVRDTFSGEGPERRDLREKVIEMLEEGDNAAALEVFDEIVRENPEDADAWYNRGELLAILNRPDEAIAAYERVLQIEPDHRQAIAEVTNLLFEQGEFGLAAAGLGDLLRRAPEQATHWLLRASSLLEAGKSTEATLVYNAVLEADPENLPATLAFGDLLLAMGDVERADRQYSLALQHHPDHPDALLKKGLLMNRQGRWGASIQFFNRAISIRWDHREAWAAKGQVLLAQGKPKDALECFDKLLTFDEAQGDAWLGKAEAHFALGENDKAAEAAGRALALDEGNRSVRDLLERLREVADRPPAQSVEVAALPPKESFDEGVLTELANALLDAGDPDAAIRGYEEVLARNPEDARAWFGKGRALHDLGRYDEALPCLTRARDLEPEDQEIIRWLAACQERVREGTS